MSYTASITVTVPAALYSVACAVARALDPDVGGAESFGPRLRTDYDGVEYAPDGYTTTTPCVPAFAQQALAIASNPAMLHYAVTADYAARWPDLTPPTLAECEAFCAGAIITSSIPDTQAP
jgi:hypothetical protein